MNSKSRVIDALNHKQPDKIPIDFGGTVCSGIHVSSVAALRDYYGPEKRLVKVYEPYQMLGLIDDDLKKVIGVDVEAVNSRKTLFGFACEDWKEWHLDNGLEVLVPGKFNVSEDGDGNKFLTGPIPIQLIRVLPVKMRRQFSVRSFPPGRETTPSIYTSPFSTCFVG